MILPEPRHHRVLLGIDDPITRVLLSRIVRNNALDAIVENKNIDILLLIRTFPFPEAAGVDQ